MKINELPIGTFFRVSLYGMPSIHLMERIPDHDFMGTIYNAKYTKSNLRTRIEADEIVVPYSPLGPIQEGY